MKMKKQNTPPQNWPAVKPNTPPPAGNDPQRMHLCQCNNCNIILIDRNPQIDAPEYALKGNEKEMVFIEENCFWACPICKTDGYLQDNITIADYSIPAGNDLPEQLAFNEEENTVSKWRVWNTSGGANVVWIDPDEETTQGTEVIEEIVRRYNDFPALQEQNKELLEALKFVSEVLPHLRPDKTLTGGDHFSLIGKIDNLKTIITKYSK